MVTGRAPANLRRRTRTLTRPQIVAAGLRLVEREGAAGLTMRNLAHELGKVPMAVYRHVRDKRELVALLLEEVSRQFVIPQTEDDPRQQIVEVVEHAHEVMERHGWMARAMLDGELLAPSSLRLSEFLVAAMERQGLPPRQAALLHVAIWQYVFGHLLIGQSKGSRMLPASYEDYTASGGDPEAYPAVRGLAPVLGGLTDKERFSAGLQALVDGAFARAALANGKCTASGGSGGGQHAGGAATDAGVPPEACPLPHSQLDDGRGPVEPDADPHQ